MFLKKRLFTVAVFFAALFVPGFAADTVLVDMNGTVTDLSGKAISGATLTITDVAEVANVSLTATTTDSGKYKFDALAIVPVLYPLQKTRVTASPYLKSDGLYFTVARTSEPVSIEIFSLSGKKVATIANAVMSAGTYHVSPFSGLSVSQTYLLKIRVGGETSTFKVPVIGRQNAGNTTVQKLEHDMHAQPAHAKKAAFSSSLKVSASGYTPVSIPVQTYFSPATDGALYVTYGGSHHFILRTPAQAAKKLVTVGVKTQNDTTATNLPIDQVFAVWVEDMQKNYVKSLFVSLWLSDVGSKNADNPCPEWRGPDSTRWGNFKATNQAGVDAVTRATPKWGSSTIDFNPDSISLQAGSVRICIEGHIKDAYNLLYVDTIAIGGADAAHTPGVVYVPSKHPKTAFDGLNSVTVSYK